MDATTITALTQALSGPGASFTLLAIVLYFGWKLLNRVIGMFTRHLESIEGKFDKLIEVLGGRMSQVEAKVDEVAEDVTAIRRRLKELAERKEQ
jgi:uncharacterized protein YlzI (FlbEa/FlbD family)